jgi:hypothetical protein
MVGGKLIAAARVAVRLAGYREKSFRFDVAKYKQFI